MDTMLTRRALLKEALLGATALGLGGCAVTPLPPPSGEIVLTRLIDAHVHIFNGADLPVRGFSALVLQQAQAITALFAGLARTAIRADREIAELRSSLAAGAPHQAEKGKPDVEVLADYFRSVEQGSGTPQPSGPAVAPSPPEDALRRQGLSQLEGALLPARDAAQPEGVAAAGAGSRATELARTILEAPDTAPRLEAVPHAMADPCEGGESRFGNLAAIFRWAALLTRRRGFILDELHRVFGAGSVPQFLTPAMVDYGFWVDDFDTTSFAQQIEVNALLSRVANTKGYALHGYMCFDPWRHAYLTSHGQAGGMLDWVRRAVGEILPDGRVTPGMGFVGVKLYPPMGFRAYGNADLPGASFPPSLRTLAHGQGKAPGALLDDAMAELFTWCAAQDVPIMAHCSASNFPHVGWAAAPPGMAAADPAFWRRALETWPSLRLNLAHSGGLATEACAATTHSAAWLGEVYALCADYPNVYADVGDLTELFADGRSAAATAIIARLKAALDRHRPAVRKILYGSDWIMQARLRGHQNYLAAMQETLVPALAGIADMPPDFADRFFWRNAQAFLALTEGSKVMTCLAPFYGPWDGLPALDRAVLGGFVARTG